MGEKHNPDEQSVARGEAIKAAHGLKPLMTEGQAAKRLGVSARTMFSERRDGRIGFRQIRRRVFYTEDDLAEYIEGCATRADSRRNARPPVGRFGFGKTPSEIAKEIAAQMAASRRVKTNAT